MPNLAKADFATGLIVGSLLSSSSKNNRVEVKDEFAKQVEQIERSLPNSYEPVTQPHYSFSVTPEEANKYLNYFKNGGYQVSYQEGNITFDLTARYTNQLRLQAQREEEHKAFEQEWQSTKPYLKGFGIFALVILLLVAFVQSLMQINQMGLLGWFMDTTVKLTTKLLKEIESTRKK